MTWLAIIALALAMLAALVAAVRPRAGVEAIAAALMLGLAGYAWQGRPREAGAPHLPDVTLPASAAALVEERRLFTAPDRGAPSGGGALLLLADAMSRHGQYADAAAMLRGAVDHDPHNSEAWLAMGNALVSNAQGTLSPAARLAFARAAAADPQAPGPPFFLGLAMAQTGQVSAARDIWLALRARAPVDAAWRSDLDRRLRQADMAIMVMRGQGGNP